METINPNNNPAVQTPAAEQQPAANAQQQAAPNNVLDTGLTISDLVYLCIANWKWFVLSVAICLSAGIYNILRTPKTYTRTTSIVIKEDGSGKSVGSDMSSTFSSMGITTSSTNVYNEIRTIKSRDISYMVAKRLALNVNYYIDGRFHEETLYGNSLPIRAQFPTMSDDETASFDLTYTPTGNFTLRNFTHNGAEQPGEVKGVMGYNMLHTPIGRLVITRSNNFNASLAGTTIHIYRTSVSSWAGRVRGSLSAAMSDKQSTVIDMSYVDVSPQRAEDILNMVIVVYNENWVNDKNQVAHSTSDFIDERLRVIESELGNVDDKISNYKSANQILDPTATGTMYMQESSSSELKTMDLNNQLYMAKYVRNYLANKQNARKLLPANLGIEGNVTQLIGEYNTKMMQRNNLVSNSSENNPYIPDIDAQLDEMRKAILAGVDNVITTLENQLKTQDNYSNQANSKISASPEQAKYLLSVERQQMVKERLYLFLLQKREENELNQAFTAYNTRVIDAPSGSNAPSGPNTQKILLIALGLGLAIPLAIIYLHEITCTTVRGKKDIEKLSMPYIGEIPIYVGNVPIKWYEFWKKKKQPKSIVVRAGSRGMINEAFRVVGTNLEFMSAKNTDRGCVYMTTSYNPGSGKSFLASNIGAILALKKKRVLVVDGDLRHSSISNVVGNPKQGLADYLGGQIQDPHEIILHSDQFQNLDYIAVGTTPPNPTELLSQPEFAQLLDQMRQEYEYILVDCPPYDMMADATIISQHVDRTIFVIRAGLFERGLLPHLEEDYQAGKFQQMAIILNGTYGATGKYGYKHGYKYGYQYGYGHGRYGYGYGHKGDNEE